MPEYFQIIRYHGTVAYIRKFVKVGLYDSQEILYISFVLDMISCHNFEAFQFVSYIW